MNGGEIGTVGSMLTSIPPISSQDLILSKTFRYTSQTRAFLFMSPFPNNNIQKKWTLVKTQQYMFKIS